jgi:hypothetical protein
MVRYRGTLIASLSFINYLGARFMYPTPTQANTLVRGRRVPGDEGLHINFSLEAFQPEAETHGQVGRPVFVDMEFIEIRIPGDDKVIIKEIVNDEYRNRFPDEYRAFREGAEIASVGTPLEHWSFLKPSQVAQFKASGLRTVEDLANMSDGNANFMGSQSIRQAAKAWLKTANDTEIVEKQEAEKKALKAELDAMKAQIAELTKKK